MSPGEPQDIELAALRAEVTALEATWEELQQRREALHAAEQRLQAILDATQNAVAILENGIMVEVNQRLVTMFGYAPEEYIGMSALAVSVPEEHEIVLAHIRSSSEESYETIAVRKGGERFPVEIRARRI